MEIIEFILKYKTKGVVTIEFRKFEDRIGKRY